MDRERIVQLFFFAFLAAMAYELYLLMKPFLVPVGWAVLLAFLVHPALPQVRRLVKSPSNAALLITLAVVIGAVLPTLWLSERLVSEAQTIYGSISALVSSGKMSEAANYFLRLKPVRVLDTELAERGIKLQEEIAGFATEGARSVSNYVLGHLSILARNILTLVVDFAIMFVTFFYLLRDGESYYEALRNLTPLHEEDKATIFETLSATLSSVMRGLMLASFAEGVAIGLAYLLLGVPYWAFLGILTAGCGLLPLGGTALVWLPAAVFLLYSAGWGRAVILVIWSALVVAVVDNFVKPAAMTHGTRLPTIALFFGIAGGLELYGPLGLFAGPAVIALFAALLRVYRRTYGRRETEPT